MQTESKFYQVINGLKHTHEYAEPSLQVSYNIQAEAGFLKQHFVKEYMGPTDTYVLWQNLPTPEAIQRHLATSHYQSHEFQQQ
ncbi:Sortilin-related receptor [Manis javanica]|nr:Sortilin-related receptor [Manis javanica]